MQQAQVEQPSLQAIRAEIEAVRALLKELEAVRLRIAKHHAALRLGTQLCLVILARHAKKAQR
eukprot:COSAG02_NODE_3145_length_7289_cov_10.121280_5_plen_63_part_00